MKDVDVLIAGAGPTGLTLACELARRGVDLRIVDRADRFFGGSRADGIQPRTMEVFADLGMLGPILAAGDLGTVMRAYQGGEVVWEAGGDAGHVHPPTGGQGMNTGVQDGYNLGWKLGAVLAGAPDRLLDSYEPERMAAARTALDLSTALLDKHKRGDDDAHERGPELHGLTLDYRGGPLSRDDRDGPGMLMAGDRAPDAPAATPDGRPVTLFDLFSGPHWTLLAFGSAHARTVAALSDRFGPAMRGYTVVRPGEPADEHTVVDGDGHVRAGYDVPDGALMLVRPDGYVGLAATPGTAEHVTDYWTALHGALVAP